MPQKTSPFIEGKYGWNLGESGWNSGMDENLLKFSFMFDKNINGIVSSLPAEVNGEAYFLTTDNRVYYVVDSTYYSTPIPKWFVLTVKSTGDTYQFDGSLLTPVDNATQITQRVNTLESSLGTAAFEDVSSFASPSDISSLVSNGSSISVIASASAYSRSLAARFSERTNVKDFGAVGDGVVDDTSAIQAAVNSSIGKTVYFPSGFYKITAPILLPNSNIIKIVGDGKYNSRIFANPAVSLTSIFDTNPLQIYDTLEISDIGFLGNNKAGSALRCEHLIHAKFENNLVMNTTSSGIRFNDGYNILIQNNIIVDNFGDGISGTGANINNVNILNNQIYANDGVGVLVANGLAVNVTGNGIEGNKLAGIMAYDIKALNIDDNYFERNAEIGYPYTVPETVQIKSDIHILSGGRILAIVANQQVECCSVKGNMFAPYGSGNFPSPGLGQHCHVFTTVADKLEISKNQCFDTAHVTFMVGLYNNNTRSTVTDMVVEHNTIDTFGFLGTGQTSFALNTAHNIHNSTLAGVTNWAEQSLNLYGIQSGSTGSIARSSQNLNGVYPSWDISVGDRVWGNTLTLSAYPELKGKYVWFGFFYKIQDVSGTGVQIRLLSGASAWTDNDGSITETLTPSGTWKFKSVCKYIDPSDTTLTYMFSRIGAAGNPLIVSLPILTVFGNSSSKFTVPNGPVTLLGTAAPTTGTWSQRNRIVNNNPTVGQPKAWVCTVSGTPGTWVSEGNL